MGKRKFKEENTSLENGPSKMSKTEQKQEIAYSNESETENCKKISTKSTNKYQGDSVFNIKHFRKELTVKQGQTIALTQFLQVCLNPSNEVDYMLEYLKAGGNSHEILRQIPTDSKKNLTLATPTFHIFHLIILKVQSSLPHMITITEEACRYFLNTFMPTVDIMISENSGPRHRKIVLNLLTSMVTLNPDLGIEVLNQAPLNPKSLHHVVERQNQKEKDNVRTAFVHFMTSFLVDGHLPLIKALLEKQGLLALVIPGLIQDDPDAVLMFLNILKKNVVENTFISKSLKLKTFGHQVLHNMFKIFSWKGSPELSFEVKNESRIEITKLLTDILLMLFTSHRLGLYFTDKFLGTSEANKNANLYKAILTLKRPWENSVECDTVLEIIYRCPDLHRAIVNVIEQNFEPQHSPIWEKTVTFVIKLLDKLKPEEMTSRMEHLSSIQAANFIRFVTLPIPLLKFISSNLGKDPIISVYCVKVLVKMLQTLRRYMQILESEDSHMNLSDLKNRLEYFIPKHFPTPIALVSLINNIIDEKEAIDTSQDYKLSALNKCDSLVYLVDLLLLYNDIHNDFFESLEGNLDMKKLLDYSTTLADGHISLLKFKIVSLWLILDNSATSLNNPMFKELFHIILEVYTSEDDSTWSEAKSTLHNFFKSTSIFEADEVEIDVMLYTLRNAKIIPTSLVGDIVEFVLKNSTELNENIRSQTVNFEISDETCQSNLDKLFNDLMENKMTEDSIFLENKIPAPFIVGGIQFMQSNKEFKKNLKQFLSLYVGNLLHSNYSPELTEVLIGDSKLDVRNYVASWIGVPAALPEKVFGKDKVLCNISKAIIEENEIALQDIFECLEICNEEDSDIVLSDIPYKINLQKPIDSSELLIWAKYLIFCLIKLTNIDQLKESQQRNILLFVNVILAISKKQHMIDVAKNIVLTLFKNRHFLKIYRPMNDGQNLSEILATTFIIDLVLGHKEMIKNLDNKHSILKAYQQKNYTDIVKTLIKINKKKNLTSDHTLTVLQVIGLTKKDDVLVLKQIFNTEVEACIKDDKEPSIVLEILKILIEKYANSAYLELTQDILRKTVKLYLELLTNNKDLTPNLTNLENAMIAYFESKPQQATHVNADCFKKFFTTNIVRKTTSKLASILLKLNVKLCSVVKEEFKKNEIIVQRELTLPLGNAVLDHNQFLQENKDILSSIYNEYKSNIVKVLEKPHKTGQVYISCWPFIKKLVLECMEPQECEKIFTKTHKFEAIELSHINLLHSAFMKMSLSKNNLQNYLINYIISLLQLLTFALKENKDANILQTITTNINTAVMVAKHEKWLKDDQRDDLKRVIEGSVWQNFCKSALKDSLKVRTVTQANVCGPQLLSILTTLVNIFYPQDHADIETLFDMVTSHSEFLNVMLSHHSSDVKSRLIEFLFALMKKNKSIMKTAQIPVFLSAYHATRSPCDRLILATLHFYESNGIPVNEYKPYLWGDSAANHYAVRKNRSSSLWGHPTPNQVLNLFEKDIIERTVAKFPVTEKLSYHYELPPCIPIEDTCVQENSISRLLSQISKDKVFKLSNSKDNETCVRKLLMRVKYDCVEKLKEQDLLSSLHVEEDDTVYDPVFVFSLLSHLLAPGSIASCFKLLRTGALSLPVMALSSHCGMMRAAAYHVLHRFWLLLETETRHKNDKLFLTDFITTLRQSLTTAIYDNDNQDLKNPRLPAIDALYLAKGLMVSTIPLDPLYKPVNNFLIAKQFVDLTLVPDFLSLFHDSDVDAADRRLWILDIIKNGTKTMTDVNVVFKTMCLKMIMDFYSSVLCDRKAKERILSVLDALISIPRCCEILIEGYGLVSWLHGVVRLLRQEDRSLVQKLICVVQNIVHSLNINAFAKHVTIKANNNSQILEGGHQFKINKEIEQDILMILFSLLNFVDDSEMEDVLPYVKVFTQFSRRTIKILSVKQLIQLITTSGRVYKNSQSIELLKKVVNNNPIVLQSKDLVNDKSDLIRELTVVVDKFIV